MRTAYPDSEPDREEALNVASEVLDYERNEIELLIDYLVKMGEEVSYVPGYRHQALGGAEVLMREDSSYWVNLVAILQDMSDEEYDEIIQAMYNWAKWEN